MRFHYVHVQQVKVQHTLSKGAARLQHRITGLPFSSSTRPPQSAYRAEIPDEHLSMSYWQCRIPNSGAESQFP